MENKILAGPILRRTTKNRVCVWLATAEPMCLELTVFDVQNNTLGKGGMDKRNSQGIKLGERLFVHLLQARPLEETGEYLVDTLLYYRVDENQNGNLTPLFSKEEIQLITYGDQPYSSFFIPSKIKNLLHGSCRKPHGRQTTADALSYGQLLMEETFDDLEKRPAILMLTGDQIYADDVAISLGALMREKAVFLTGQKELMPQIGDPGNIALQGRKQVLQENKSGFSSGESHNHLFTFGEYAAMYVYAFGNLQGWEPIYELEKLKNLGIAENEKNNVEKVFAEETNYLQAFQKTLPGIRRLLANIPTYMMFDDHEVTDDWNITHSWYDDVRQSGLGRRIVANALAACWAFQSWGNDPDNFNKDMVRSIRQKREDQTRNAAIDERYDLHTWKHRGWGFSVPTVPPVLAIDSRTQRQYDDYNLPAQLMDRYALDWLRVEWAKVATDVEIPDGVWPVLIAATPVLGFAPMESLQAIALRAVKFLLNYLAKKFLFFISWFEGPIDRALVNILDIESWFANKKGYKAFFDTLVRMKLPGCIFLSGDVHYAFTAKGVFESNGKKFPSLQFTSSAFSNMPGERNEEMIANLGDRLPRRKDSSRFKLSRSKCWVSLSTLLPPNEKSTAIHTGGNIGLVQFSDGRPVSHTLLTAHGKLTYEIK